MLSGHYQCHLALHQDKKMFIMETAVSSNENALPCRDLLLCLVFLRTQRLMKTLLYPHRHFLIINS